MNITFSSLDTYKVSHKKKDEKLNIDYKVLLRLYGPIIGSDALSLYLMLESELSLNKGKRTTLKISRLLKLLQMNDDNQLNEAVDNLKNYGLLSYKANTKKENDYMFILHPTISADEFFNDEKLNGALEVMVDEYYFNQVKEYFISKHDEIDDEDDYVEIETLATNKVLSEKSFFEEFYEKYPVIANSCVISNDVRKEVARLIKLYNLSYSELEKAIFQSIVDKDNQMIIDANLLNDVLANAFKESLAKKDNNQNISDLFKNKTPHGVFMENTNRSTLLPSETTMIDELIDMITHQGMDEKVLNVIFDFYFRYSNGSKTRPSKNYFIKVIEEMVMNDVKTIEDAITYFKNRNERIKRYKEKKENIKNTNNIDAKNDTIKESIPDNTNSKELDEEEIRKFKELLGG